MVVTDDELDLVFSQLGDLAAVWNARGRDVNADGRAVADVLVDLCRLAGPPWNIVGPILIPRLEPFVVEAIEQNRSMEPGALTRIASGKRGS